MKPRRAVGVLLLATLVLSDCAPYIRASNETAKLCRVAVEEPPDSFVFHANPMFSPVGGPVLGTGAGALAAASALIFPLNAPAAVLAVGIGIECGAASSEHPNAETDFRSNFESADRAALRRALDAELKARLAGCRTAADGASGDGHYDAVIRIERVEYTMACSRDREKYSITVKWRGVTTPGERPIRDGTTYYRQESPLEVDNWGADAAAAHEEIVHALSLTGQQIAAQFLAPDCWDLATKGIALVEARDAVIPAGGAGADTFDKVVWRSGTPAYLPPKQPSEPAAGTLVLAERSAFFVPRTGAIGVTIPYEVVQSVEIAGSAPGEFRSLVVRSCFDRADEFIFAGSGNQGGSVPDAIATAVAQFKARIAAARSADRR